MFLRCHKRKKDGKDHHYWSIVENKRLPGGKVVQKAVLYLGEINDSQRQAWQKTIDVFEAGQSRPRTVALFPEERPAAVEDDRVVHIRLKDLTVHRPRQWGGCWLACELYEQLHLPRFWAERLPPSRKGTRWDLILQTLVSYRLLDPGSEWRLHRHWFEESAMADLLGEDFGLAEIHKLYECLDLLLPHKEALFGHLTQRWKDLFNAKYELLLYDLTSTYFESDPPSDPEDKRRFGYSRDKRPDCTQIVIGLIVTPEGFPLAYEVLPGNTSDKTTLEDFLNKIESRYGKAQRIWLMDRGIPTEEILAKMREQSDPPVYYLVGTPKGRLSRYEKQLAQKPWQKARQDVKVKLLPQDGELYVMAHSQPRMAKERGIRVRQLKRLWKRLKELQHMDHKNRDELLMRLGAVKQNAPKGWRLVEVHLAEKGTQFTFELSKDKLRKVRRQEGRYLLRSNLCHEDPAKLWELYNLLTQVEQAFQHLKGDLAIRPIYHQKQHRIEAHIFVAFLAYCLHVTLRRRLRELAPGLTPRAVLEKFASLQMIDVHLPTTDGQNVILSRYTQPSKEVKILLQQLQLSLPEQPPPKITASGTLAN